jgi:putative ABC transport system permease protein
VLDVALLEGAEPTPVALAQAGVRLGLVNQTLARHLGQFGPVIGQVVARTAVLRYRVVGVMPDVILDRPDRPVEPTLFAYLAPAASIGVVVLARLEPGRTAEQVGIPTVLDQIWGARAPRPFPLDDAVRLATADFRARTLLLGLISALCVPLTIVGVAGALRYATTQRTREIAIELAIGAEPRDVERRIVRQAIGAAAMAIVGGLTAGTGIARLMPGTLFGVGAVDPSAIGVSVAAVLLVAWGAALLPARRAGRISPAEALREG